MKYCKYCEKDKEKFPKYDGINERNMCCDCYSKDTYSRALLKRLEERPKDLWFCINCDSLNSILRKHCRVCKKNTKEESIAEDNKERNL